MQGIDNQVNTKVEKGNGSDEISYRIEVENLLTDKKCHRADRDACKVSPDIFSLDKSGDAGYNENQSPPAVKEDIDMSNPEGIDARNNAENDKRNAVNYIFILFQICHILFLILLSQAYNNIKT